MLLWLVAELEDGNTLLLDTTPVEVNELKDVRRRFADRNLSIQETQGYVLTAIDDTPSTASSVNPEKFTSIAELR